MGYPLNGYVTFSHFKRNCDFFIIILVVFQGECLISHVVFLDASTHLYKRVCTSVGLLVGLLVGNHLFLLVGIIKKDAAASLLAYVGSFHRVSYFS